MKRSEMVKKLARYFFDATDIYIRSDCDYAKVNEWEAEDNN